MAIEFLLESLDGVGDEQKALYKETDEGKFQLDVAAYDAYRDKREQAVNTKNRELLTEKKNLKAIADKFKDFDDDKLAAFQEFLIKQDSGDPADPDPKKGEGKDGTNVAELQAKWERNHEQQTKKLKDLHKTEVDGLKSQITALTDQHERYVTKTTLHDVALQSGVLPERLEPFVKTCGDRFKLNEQKALVALDEEGDPLDVKPSKFIADTLREQYPFFFKAAEQGGSGAGGNNGGGDRGAKQKKRAAFEKLSPAEQSKFIRGGGQVID